MLRPMIFANIALASHATHVGLFAQLSRLPHSQSFSDWRTNFPKRRSHSAVKLDLPILYALSK